MKGNVPLVSVAMATYNGERFLREQLDSIYNQTYKNIEVVVTDDCSTDQTVTILEEYRLKYGLIYFVNEENLGFIKNFEKAMSLCNGEYIALSDQDDIWKPEKLETLVKEIGEYSLIYSPAREEINAKGEVINSYKDIYFIWLSRFGNGNPIKRLIACNWVVSHQLLFKRSLIEFALPIPSNQNYHDAWLALVASKQKGIKFLSQGLMYYRRHESSFTYPSFRREKNKFKSLFKFFYKQTQDLKINKFKSEIKRLTDILNCGLFVQERDFILDLINYYQDRVNKGFHWRAGFLALKYADLFFTNDTYLLRIKFVLSSLIT